MNELLPEIKMYIIYPNGMIVIYQAIMVFKFKWELTYTLQSKHNLILVRHLQKCLTCH